MAHRFPYLDHPLPLAFAHRGGALAGRENTAAAFERAVGLGYRYVETDVHLTADGVLVAFHDSTLDRVTDRTGVISELPWAQVKRARIGGAEPIPLLEDLLGAWPDLRFNIDPKADASVGPLVEAIRRTNALDRVCLGSFSGRRLGMARAALGSRLCTSTGPREVAALRFGSWLLPPPGANGRSPRVPCVQIPTAQNGIPIGDARLIRRAHALGMQVHIWTVDDPAEMRRLLDLGVDGIMTDDLETLRSVYQERGLWPS
ncbi:glycerophosphodiester phosphodiesterase [Fodinicola feengrottensis]|uniref:Glycerophosphodiester phosphodiesterase n=1 Tax=Fodinicola feengrottensis TaxID=435914 RepID=A0ABN2HW46_9ACTN